MKKRHLFMVFFKKWYAFWSVLISTKILLLALFYTVLTPSHNAFKEIPFFVNHVWSGRGEIPLK